MTAQPLIPTDAIVLHDNQVRTTSLKVAEAFGKRHDNVIRKLQTIDCSQKFNELNFEGIEYTDGRGRQKPAFEMTKDGFVFLVMGFTGHKAAQVKEAYIAAFNEMAAQLYGGPIQGLTPAQQREIQQIVSRLAQRPGNTYASLYRGLKDHFQVGTYKDIPAERFGSAKAFLMGVESIEGDYEPAPPTLYHYPIETAKPRTMPLPQQAWLTHEAVLDPGYGRPCEKLLNELAANGHDISGAAQEYKALYLLARTGSSIMHEMRDLADNALMRGLNTWFGPRH
ncbi:Rha family transcriptional regulator [Microbulbifer celer]|uniref:Rha family transcriptional regulator n=1 Tax=Microbulbifer celer TaxID=435905 RepID=A0ABW3U975_9GAMM|nr:Rha family transcriptional regulator [Microbulbifer celer]UFN58590.1 Rha family transcriptional regulator [Microbulbifer celer]